jgi:hypothetical protein
MVSDERERGHSSDLSLGDFGHVWGGMAAGCVLSNRFDRFGGQLRERVSISRIAPRTRSQLPSAKDCDSNTIPSFGRASVKHWLSQGRVRKRSSFPAPHLDEMATHRYVAPYNSALVYISLGQIDRAFEWLERAYQARSYLLAPLTSTPMLGSGRSTATPVMKICCIGSGCCRRAR